MPRVSEEIRRAAIEGRWDLSAQRAAVWADLAPQLYDACVGAYYAICRAKIEPAGLKEASALCWHISTVVARSTGMEKTPESDTYLASAGLPYRAQVEAAKAAEKALGRLESASADDSALYHVRA